MGYNLENPFWCSESPLPALKPVVLQVTDHHGGLPEAEQQTEKNYLIAFKNQHSFISRQLLQGIKVLVYGHFQEKKLVSPQ